MNFWDRREIGFWNLGETGCDPPTARLCCDFRIFIASHVPFFCICRRDSNKIEGQFVMFCSNLRHLSTLRKIYLNGK